MTEIKGIGVFDSGVGGLTVAQELFQQLPGEQILYFGDTAHVPYGSKTVEQLHSYAKNIVEFLITQGAKMVVVACNTSSAVALDMLKEKFSIPIIEVIKPGARFAAQVTKNKKIGVIATEATIRSGAYQKSILEVDPLCQYFGQACPRYVPLVENGLVDSQETREVTQEYLAPLKEAGIDTLILGCTHYPYLRRVIQEYLGPGITIVDPAFETVAEAKKVLAEKGLLRGGKDKAFAHVFYASGAPDSFYRVGQRLLGPILTDVKQVNLD